VNTKVRAIPMYVIRRII